MAFELELENEYMPKIKVIGVGGAGNIVSAAHCATRLRLVIADNSKVDKKALEDAEGAKGVFEAQGQLQIIFGTGTVNKVFEAFTALSGVQGGTKEDVKQAAAAKAPLPQRLIKTLGDIFVPIIPAIVASGFLMGIMEALNFMVNNGFLDIDTSGSIYVISIAIAFGVSFAVTWLIWKPEDAAV